MGFIVDIVLIAILAVFILIGYVKGLTGSILKIASFFISIVLVVVLYKPVSNLIIDKTLLDEKIESTIIETFEKEKKQEESQEPQEIAEKNENEKKGFQETIVNTINESIENAAIDAKNQVIEQTAGKIATTVIRIGTGIAIYLSANLILLIVSLIAKGVTELPVIKQVDKAGGIIFGLIEGIIIVFIALAVIYLSSALFKSDNLIKMINDSAITGFLYNNNLLIKLFIK